VSGSLIQPEPAAGVWVPLGPAVAGPRPQLLPLCPQGVPGAGGGGGGPGRCGCTGRRQGEGTGLAALLACVVWRGSGEGRGSGGGGCGLAGLAPSHTRPGAAATWPLCLRRQALIPLSLEGTEVGQTKAAQALAKITITSNPEMAFPGERASVAAVGWGMGLPSRGLRGHSGLHGGSRGSSSGDGAPHVHLGCCSRACVCSGEALG